MRAPDNIRSLLEVGPDFMGLIFFEGSKRFPADLNPADLPDRGATELVGVFVNETVENILETAAEWGLDWVQLHGDEDLDFVMELKEHGIRVIKVFRINDQLPEDLNEFEPWVDLFLFDTRRASGYGGTGKQFDWSILACYPSSKGYLLSGGIGEDDLDKLEEKELPGCIGIDINSAVELEPGMKDIEKIKRMKERL